MTTQTGTETSASAPSTGMGHNAGPPLDDYLTPEDQAKELNKSTRTLARWRAMRCGPPYTRVGRGILYRRRWTATWLERNALDPELETGRKSFSAPCRNKKAIRSRKVERPIGNAQPRQKYPTRRRPP